MNNYWVICFIVFCSFYLPDVSCDQVDLPVSVACLGCLCNAASGCDTENMCVEDACGPYRITRGYWIDSGTPTFNKMNIADEETFSKCASNFYCSIFAVQEYMKRYKRDCNGDGNIGCDDFVAIHALGSEGCGGSLPEDYKQRYEKCKSKYTGIRCKEIDVPVSIACINCLCQAASACQTKDFCKDGYCGAFRVSEDYWSQAGKPTVNRLSSEHPNAFKMCANDFYCVFFAIQRYMEKNQKDCNGDGKIDCDDFMRIHKLGPAGCNGTVPDTYQGRYEFCQAYV